MVEITYQMVLSTLQTAGLLICIFYYLMALRNQQKNQEISLKNQEISLKNQEETLKTRNATLFLQTIGQIVTNNEALKHILRIENHPFSSIEEYHELMKDPEYALSNIYMRVMCDFWGIFLKNDIIDIKMISQFQPYWAPWFWEMNKEQIYESRKERQGFYENMEYFVNSLQKYKEENPEQAPLH